MTYTDVSAQQLIEFTKIKSDYVLVDCRSFLVYNKEHISGAVNVRCNSIMKRRNKGAFLLENALTNGDIRADFLAGKFSTVVVYDDLGGDLQQNENLSSPKSRRTMTMVLGVLQQHAPLQTLVAYLKCGFKEFSRRFPEMCSGDAPTASETIPQENKDLKNPSSILTPVYDQGIPVEILPHLYLGSAFHASQKSHLDILGIKSVLNASSTCPNYFENKLNYKRIPVEDNSQADISRWFNEAINFINDAKSSNQKVLVHCHAGISRSATLCLAYLIVCHKVSLSDAFQYVKCRRSVISPNFNFMGQLLKLEAEVASCEGRKSRFPDQETKENMHTNRRPLSQNLNLTTPLGAYSDNVERSKQICLTAPPCLKEFSFFADAKLSCSRESAELQNHSRRSLALST